MARRALLTFLLVVPGLVITAICCYYALQDYGQLVAAYRNFNTQASTSNNLRVIFTSYAIQDIHRMNVFADAVWALLGAILAGLGLHGLCVMPPVRRGDVNND